MRKAFFQLRQQSDRLMWVWGGLVLVSLLLFIRLVNLQLIEGNALRQKVKGQQFYELQPFVPRRTIIDRNHQVLAIDRPAYLLYAHPLLFKESKSFIALKLAPILKEPVTALEKKFESETIVNLGFWLTEEQASAIRSLQLDGLELVLERKRYYPQQDLAAEVLGYVDFAHIGQAGVELKYQNKLNTTLKKYPVSRDGLGRLIPSSIRTGLLLTDRTVLELTLDERTQRVGRQLLRESIQKYGAKRGAVMVMEVETGAMRALVTEPTYDPNRYFDYSNNQEVFKNWAVSDLYEPGSTFKPINVAIALESGHIQPDSIFYDEGILTIDGWPVANFDYESKGVVGPLTISEILQRSSNVGMVHIAQQIPPSVYYGWLQRLGLGGQSGIDLPSEESSVLKTQEQFTAYQIEAATTSFGQGFSLTPIQMLQLQGVIASGGKLLTPHVVKSLVSEEGEVYYQPRIAPQQIFSPTTTGQVLRMMEEVVEKGTGKPAHIPGYRLGGKTGTAQKADENFGYVNAKITSFVGIFPVDAPRFVILAVIDEPLGDDAFGSTVAAPIVKGVIEDLIVAEKIPPSHPEELLNLNKKQN